jgi:hypothetical protein
VLLPFVKDAKQYGDAFREKLCARFEALHEASAATAADLAAAAAAERAAAAAATATSAGAVPEQAAASDAEISGASSAPQGAAMDMQGREEMGATLEGGGGTSVDVKEEAMDTVAASGPAAASPGGPAADRGAGGGTARRDSLVSGGGRDHSVVREWRMLAACLKLMGYSEKGFRRMVELLRCYKHALGDREVFAAFWVRRN